MATDEQIEKCSREYHAQVAIVRELKLDIDTKREEITVLQTKLTAGKVQLQDKKNALKDALNAA